MRTFRKQKHGEPNPIFGEEELRILSAKEQALVCGNPQVIGRNGEVPLVEFLRRYLPSTFRVETGFFVTPAGHLSPQIDILILDSRYPLLSHNKDGSVITMLHSVVQALEVKTTVAKREVNAILGAAEKTRDLSLEVFPGETFGAVGLAAIAYATSLRLDTLEDHFFDPCRKIRQCDLTLLRVDKREFASGLANVGAELHWEPRADEEDGESEGSSGPKDAITDQWIETTRFTQAPLSDLYYRLVQDGYYALDARSFSFGDIGAQMMDYMSWGTMRGPETSRE
jgi:hypothetical protein